MSGRRLYEIWCANWMLATGNEPARWQNLTQQERSAWNQTANEARYEYLNR